MPVIGHLCYFATAICLHMTVLEVRNIVRQAFGNGFGPFLEHLQDEDFLHAVCNLLLHVSTSMQALDTNSE